MRMSPLVLLVVGVPCASLVGQATWAVDPAPILDVPGVSADGKVVFGFVAGATRLSDGSLLIADRDENAIRVVDAKGKLVRTVGRAGDGPGEFQSILWAGRCGTDSLLVWDLRRNQASMVGSSGTAARQFTVPARDTAQPPFQFACSPAGTMAYQSLPRPDRSAPPSENQTGMAVLAGLYRVGSDGSIQGRFGDIPAGEVVLMTSPNGGRGTAPRPLGRAAAMTVVGSSVVIGSADSAMVTVRPPGGAAKQIRLPISRRAPTRAEFDAAVEQTASMIPGPIRSEMASQLAALPMPDRIPAITALFGDPAGLLWVQSSPVGARSTELMVVRLDGSIVARARIPASLAVHEIGRDYILGSTSDADDEPHLVVYRLRRTP